MTLRLHGSSIHHFPERGRGGIALFGATGRTGREVAALACERDIQVRALIRPGSGPVHGDADILVGSPMDHETVGRVIEGARAVCCVFGPHPPFTDLFTAAATSVILSQMRERGVARIVCVTGAMIGRYPRNRSIAFRMIGSLYRKANRPGMLDRDRQEEMVVESGLDWTVVKPPHLTDGKPRGKYRAGTDVKVGMLSRIRRADLAHFLIEATVAGRALGEAVFLRY